MVSFLPYLTFADSNYKSLQTPKGFSVEMFASDIVIPRQIAEGKIIGSSDFLSSFLDGQKSWGRPSASLILRDGSLLVSDGKHNAIYRITYT